MTMAESDRHAQDGQTRITTRLPEDLHEALRTYVFLTRESANSVITTAVRTFLETTGRERMLAASREDTLKLYSTALDKLADS